jgi:transitional endoplasmic reticulum ATPase
MEANYKGILSKGFSINEMYNVLLFIKQGSNAETYRVKGNDGKLYFLKLFNYVKLHRSAFDDENNLLEIEFLKKIKHENIVSYKDSGELIFEGKKFGYLVLNFIAGETLAEKISRESFGNFYDIQQIILDVLNGLSYLHQLSEPIIHNEITPQNIMLDLSGDIPKAILIDFGYARSFHQSTKSYNKVGLNLNYIASECFNGLYSPQSDLYSVGATMYQMLFKFPPWHKEISKFQADKINAEEVILQERSKPLSFKGLLEDFLGYDETINLIIKKALSQDLENRFINADEFIKALKKEIEVEDIDKIRKVKSDEKTEKSIILQKAKGKGFDAVAGMSDLKKMLTTDVIDALKNPEKYEKYGISLTNGILFYGPPRCGKTYFAMKFAEEVGFNFIEHTPGTIKSPHVFETENNITKMFVDAEKSAPTIIFIDEIDDLVPNCNDDVHQMTLSVVNTMLAHTGDQNLSKKGIFFIGATNNPLKIDPRFLGAGRLEKKFYIGPPDYDLRKSLFETYLKNRPLDFGIDYDKLSSLTENYVTGDIELLVNEAAKEAMLSNQRISMEILEHTIKIQQPTISKNEIDKYKDIKDQMEGKIANKKNNIPRVGF